MAYCRTQLLCTTKQTIVQGILGDGPSLHRSRPRSADAEANRYDSVLLRPRSSRFAVRCYCAMLTSSYVLRRSVTKRHALHTTQAAVDLQLKVALRIGADIDVVVNEI
jgi:hypothetical protein